jgi:uncharacterized cupredoxin-like copper-binding protein
LARVGLITTSLVGSMALGGGSLVALAQDASPAASPAAECVPATITDATPSAAASPEAMASPEAAPALASTPADEATTQAAVAAAENIAACPNDPAALATLVTANLDLTHPFGGFPTIAEAMANGFFEDSPYGGGVRVGDVITYEDGSVGAKITYMQSQYQAVGEMWNLVNVDGTWKLNAVANAEPDVESAGFTAAVGVKLGENEDGTYYLTPNVASVKASDILVLQGTNEGKEPHEMVMVQLPEGVDPMGLLDGSVSEDQVNFIGFVFMPHTGDIANMTLVNLPAGKYTLLCFIPGPDGAPHAAHGMISPFEVTAAE